MNNATTTHRRLETLPTYYRTTLAAAVRKTYGPKISLADLSDDELKEFALRTAAARNSFVFRQIFSHFSGTRS
jgi:hypothetical protein